MLQTVAARIPAAVDYERTLILAIEVSNKSWVLAAQVPGLPHTKAKRTIDPEAEALLAAIAGYRARAVATGCSIERVIAVYEAGWSGFWLARWLMRHGVEVYVVQPSSVPVDRRMRRAKLTALIRSCCFGPFSLGCEASRAMQTIGTVVQM
jgi:transposase